jgi:hypothetical protein
MTIRKIDAYGASLGANTFTGAQVAPSLAIGGATIGTNALAVTGTAAISGAITGDANIIGGAGSALGWNSRSLVLSPSDGIIRLSNSALTDFTRLQFGGTTNLFPAIKRNGTLLNFRLADDSADAPITAASLALGNTLTMTSSSSFYPQAVLANLVADANGPYIVLRKGRAAGTTTQNGDALGNILFSGYASDNSIFNGPSISVVATGAASATGIATSTIFNTSTSSGATEAFRYDTNGSVSVIGSVTSRRTTAIPAGGAAGVGILFSSTSNYGIFFGSGAPTLNAAKGSLYLRSDGTGVADRMYVNTDASTTWTAVATVA